MISKQKNENFAQPASRHNPWLVFHWGCFQAASPRRPLVSVPLLLADTWEFFLIQQKDLIEHFSIEIEGRCNNMTLTESQQHRLSLARSKANAPVQLVEPEHTIQVQLQFVSNFFFRAKLVIMYLVSLVLDQLFQPIHYVEKPSVVEVTEIARLQPAFGMKSWSIGFIIANITCLVSTSSDRKNVMVVTESFTGVLPIMTAGPRTHSSPCCPTDNGFPVTVSTTLASTFSVSRPADRRCLHSSWLIILDTPPASVDPYPCNRNMEKVSAQF